MHHHGDTESAEFLNQNRNPAGLQPTEQVLGLTAHGTAMFLRPRFGQVEPPLLFVMAGLDPAISGTLPGDPRVKPGDDDWGDRT